MARWLLRLAAIALLLGIPPTLQPERAHACVCGAVPTVAESLENAGAVFAGRVVSEDPVFAGRVSIEELVVEFHVSRVWKGERVETIFVNNPFTTCRIWYYQGSEYLVYASDVQDIGLLASLCGRTRLLEYAQGDLVVLGEGQPPEPGTSAPRPGESPSPIPPVAGTGMPVESRTSGSWLVGVLAGASVVAGLTLLSLRLKASRPLTHDSAQAARGRPWRRP